MTLHVSTIDNILIELLLFVVLAADATARGLYKIDFKHNADIQLDNKYISMSVSMILCSFSCHK